MNTIKTILGTGCLLLAASSVQADQVIADDLIVQFSTCSGNDCANGESFGFDTLRLKENNLRIHFDDTSSSASFPATDWRIIVNDISNGGLNRFSIEDSTAGRVPFTIEGNAPTNSLYVDDAGRLGLGTAAPVVDIHTVTGNTPTIRLDQDGSSGFTAQTWDVAGNESNFFVRDATNGSTLPFRIKPSAPTNAISIDADGDVGMGLQTAEASLHLRNATGDTQLLVEETNATQGARSMLVLKNNGNPELVMTNTGAGVSNTWTMSAGLRYVVKNNAGDWVSRISATGDMEITGALITAGGTCGGGCDMVFHPDTEIESIEEHATSMWTNSYLPSVGPTIENTPINLSEKTGGMLNELEKAHIYIEQLHNRLAALEAEQAELKQAVMTLVRKNDDGVLFTSN